MMIRIYGIGGTVTGAGYVGAAADITAAESLLKVCSIYGCHSVGLHGALDGHANVLSGEMMLNQAEMLVFRARVTDFRRREGRLLTAELV